MTRKQRIGDILSPFLLEVGEGRDRSEMNGSKTTSWELKAAQIRALLLFLQQQISNKLENKMSQQLYSEEYEAGNELYSPHEEFQAINRSAKYTKKQLGKKPSLDTIDRIIEAKKATNYYWTDSENKRYANFLAEFGYMFAMTPRERRQKKINLLMSKRVRTRNPVQCHSHHQKMVKKYGCLAEIIKNLQGETETGVKIEECNSPITFISNGPTCSQSCIKQEDSVKEVLVSGITLELPSNCIIIDCYEEVNNDYEYGLEKLLEWIEW